MSEEQLATEQAVPEKVEAPADESNKSTEVPRDLDAEPEPTETEKPEGETEVGETKDATEEKPEDEDKEAPKKKLTGSERLKRRLAAAEAENAALRSRSSDGEVSGTELEKRIGKPPKEDEYKGDYLAFERALTAYELDKRQVTRELRNEIERAKAARSEQMREALELHEDRVEEFRALAPDYEKAVSNSGPASPLVKELILESEKSAQLAYHLSKNPTTLARLNDMTEREAAREIGRLESKLSLPPKTITNAPKPVTPPKGGVAPKLSLDNATMAQYIKMRKADNG